MHTYFLVGLDTKRNFIQHRWQTSSVSELYIVEFNYTVARPILESLRRQLRSAVFVRQCL